MAGWGMENTMAKVRDMQDMPDTPRAEYEESVMATPPMGDDMHNHINAISEIDGKIAQLKKRRAQMVEAFQMKMEEIGKHYADVVDGPRESDGRY